MAEVLMLRLAGPMMSFGSAAVDAHHPSAQLPQQSALAGLLGNALGLDRTEHARLAALQQAVVFAARADSPGVREVDYQTVDLGSAKMSRPGWTTAGRLETRAPSTANRGRHVMRVHYLANAAVTVALQLRAGAGVPGAQAAAAALGRPARPLYLGRAAYPPSSRLAQAIVQAPDVLAALADWPLSSTDVWRAGLDAQPGDAVALAACWPADLSHARAWGSVQPVSQQRDWLRQVHVGQQLRIEGRMLVRVAGQPSAHVLA